MSRVLVTGGDGQLASCLKKIAPNFIYLNKSELDLTDKPVCEDYFKSHNIEYLVNCAAYTNVDGAELNEDDANAINSIVAGFLADMANKYGFFLIHISTDYVFSGDSNKPYSEEDFCDPSTVYGKTKLLGENNILRLQNSNVLIIRTSWLYSEFNSNFPKTMLRLSESNDVLKVVDDQRGVPTYAMDLAVFICFYLNLKVKPSFALLNFSNLGDCTWFDFAKKIFELKNINQKVLRVKTSDINFRAPRPNYSVLDLSKLRSNFNFELRSWEQALEEMLSNL